VPRIANYPPSLSDEHHARPVAGIHPNWQTRSMPQGVAGSGEFLTCHGNFIAKFPAWRDAQPNAHQVAAAPWDSIPTLLPGNQAPDRVGGASHATGLALAGTRTTVRARASHSPSSQEVVQLRRSCRTMRARVVE
jgi:hypothetical protein